MVSSEKSDKSVQIANLLARWRRLIVEAGPTNKELAVEAIEQLCKINKTDRPLILWCESPAQLSVIPCLIANISHAPGWHKIVDTLSKESSDSSNWRSQWQSHWSKFENDFVRPLVDKIWNFQYSEQDNSVREKTIRRLQEHMLLVFRDERVKSGKQLGDQSQPPKDGVLRQFAMYGDTQTQQARVAAEISKRTTSKFTMTPASAIGMFHGVFDHRILTEHLPQGFLNAETTKDNQAIEELRIQCQDLDNLANAMSAWKTRVLTGSAGPMIDPANFNLQGLEFHQMVWRTYHDTRKIVAEALKQPRGNQMAFWGVSSNWLPFALACRILEPQLLEELEETIDCLAYLAHAADGYVTGKKVCFVSEKPLTLVSNAIGQPHNATGPAATWSDGFTVYSWRGVFVEPSLIERKQDISPDQITNEKNAEIRRVMLEIFGEERYLRESGATMVQKDECGELYKVSFPGDEALTMVRVRNSSQEKDGTYKYYFLRVPPTIETAKEGVAWTFGVDASEYFPVIET